MVGARHHPPRQHDLGKAFRQVPGIGGRAELVGNHANLLSVRLRLQNRPHEVAAPRPEQPRASHHIVPPHQAPHRLLAGQLRGPVDAQRIRRIELCIRFTLGPVEHEIGAHIDQSRSNLGRGPRHVPRPPPIVQERPRRIALTPVYISPRRAVHHHLRPRRAQRLGHRGRLRHIEVLDVNAADLVLARQGLTQIAPQHPSGTGHQHLHN